MNKKVLLLTQHFEFNSFVEIKRAIKLMVNNKVEPISYWEDWVHFSSGKIQLPSILKLVNPIKKINFKSYSNFNRNLIIKRDKSTCQYCQKILSHKQVTIDHIIPRSKGGVSNFNNCVVCCFDCNKRKGNKMLEQSNMKLISKPSKPNPILLSGHDNIWHKDWEFYLK